MFFSIEQVKAARALLKWTQKDLAKHAGLKDDQIYNYEAGRSRAPDILEAVYEAFSRENVVFLEDGVQRQTRDIIIYDDYLNILEDASSVLAYGDELLLHRADERRSGPEVVAKSEEMMKAGIIFKLTICEGNTFVRGNADSYRWIPKDYFGGSQVEAIYADRYVIHVRGSRDEFVCIRNQTLADVHRHEFYYWWNKGKHVEQG